MFPPLVSTRSGTKSQHLKDVISTGNTGSPTILAIKLYSKLIITETFILTSVKYGDLVERSEPAVVPRNYSFFCWLAKSLKVKKISGNWPDKKYIY